MIIFELSQAFLQGDQVEHISLYSYQWLVFQVHYLLRC